MDELELGELEVLKREKAIATSADYITVKSPMLMTDHEHHVSLSYDWG